jgi:hypothetical protein
MFPNAELALMFIPVPIKAKYFCTRFSFSRFVFRSPGQSIFVAVSHIFTLEVLYLAF